MIRLYTHPTPTDPIFPSSTLFRSCRASESPRLGGEIAFTIGAMLTLFAALALAAQSTPVPPQATQLPPPVPPIPAPVTPVVEADTRDRKSTLLNSSP